MGKKFAEYSKLDLSDVNGKVLEKWDENQVFAKSMTEREGCPSFVFFEGPPSANGMPGIHHVMARSIKDIFCRYKTMKGFQVKRKAGWDTHGLPVELGVEKALGITKEDIGKTISVAEYNAACRWEPISIYKACWIESDNAEQLADFKRRKHTNMAVDKHGRDVFLADTSYALALAQENFKDIRFYFTSEF